MDLFILLATGFILGAFICLLFTLAVVFKSHQSIVSHALIEVKQLSVELEAKVEEFKAIGVKASEANESWSKAFTDFDLKIKDLENRIAMMRMQR